MVRDRIDSIGERQVQNWFHFDTDVAPLKSKTNVQVVSENGHATRLQLWAFPADGTWLTENGWVSHCYGEKREAPVFSFSVLVKGSEELVTFILPEVTGVRAKPIVREIEATGGRAFEINHDGKHDVLLLRRNDRGDKWPENEFASRVETARMASDFDLTWVRFENERARSPDELIVLAGRSFELEGREILKSTRTIPHLVATRTGDKYRIETEEGVSDVSDLNIVDP